MVIALVLGLMLTIFIDFGQPQHQEGKTSRQRLNRLLFSQIESDLEPWSNTGITLEQVERTYCTTFEGGYVDGGFRLQIIAGEMFVVGELKGYAEFNRGVKLFLVDLARHHKLPDVDLVLSTSDRCHPPGAFAGDSLKCPSLAPLFSYAKSKEDKHCVLYPDHTFAGWPTVNLPSWQDVWELMEGSAQPGWEERQDKLYFRGATTGNRVHAAKDPKFMDHPHVDAEFSRWTGDPSGKFVSLPEHCNFKYLLHLPGQAYSSRIKNLLLCKAPIIFPFDGTSEFWYRVLQDGDNVVMTEELTHKTGGTEIVKALEKLRKDESLAQRIGTMGYEVARRSLHPVNVRRYYAQLLIAYAALQSFPVEKHPDAIPMAISALSPDANFTMAGRTCNVC